MVNILLKGTSTHVFELSPESRLADLKTFIASKEQIDNAPDIALFAQGRVLDSDDQLACLQDGSLVDCCMRLLGGKVHGSLARAGKVKGQTPKVEKQEKKRKKCGRARRRILYQKRFVNVVNAMGKRRGPNSNA